MRGSPMSRRPRIGDHDLDVKMAQAEKHFEKGYKARAARYRGSCPPLHPFATGVSTAWSAADAEAFAAQVRFLVNLRKPNERDAGQQILDRVRERMEPLAKVRRAFCTTAFNMISSLLGDASPPLNPRPTHAGGDWNSPYSRKFLLKLLWFCFLLGRRCWTRATRSPTR